MSAELPARLVTWLVSLWQHVEKLFSDRFYILDSIHSGYSSGKQSPGQVAKRKDLIQEVTNNKEVGGTKKLRGTVREPSRLTATLPWVSSSVLNQLVWALPE